jgi:hypothetical protein
MHKVINNMLELNNTPMQESVAIYGRDNKNVSLKGALYNMVMADILCHLIQPFLTWWPCYKLESKDV